MNREDWLHAMAARFVPDFESAGHIVPVKLSISVGFPSQRALSAGKQAIGQCWSGTATSDGTVHVFVSPVISDASRAADVLLHELCHAVLPAGTAHKAPFAKLAKQMGLEGKPTSTIASKALEARLATIIKAVGPYPHVALGANLSAKKQSTRLLKVACSDCGYTVRVTAKWLERGAPICPSCEEPMEEA